MLKRICSVFLVAGFLANTPVRGEGTVHRIGSVRTGQLTYPALNHLDFREGTIEFWLKLAFDPADYLSGGRFTGLLRVLHLAGEDGGGQLRYFAQGDSLRWSVSKTSPLTPIGPAVRALTPGRWYHLALMWQGREMALYLDGERIAGREQVVPLHQVFGRLDRTQTLNFGDPAGRQALMVIDDLRISRVAREPRELGFFVGEHRPDIYTAVLDPFEEDFVPDGETTTQPRVTWTGSGGLPSRECRFVPGKFGRGLAFFTPTQE
jgi:hypothetical protein